MRYCSTSVLVLVTVGLAACGGGGSAGGGSGSGNGSESSSGGFAGFERTPVSVDFTTVAAPATFEDAEYFRSGALDQVNASSIYSVGGTGQGQLIAVVDTGIDTDHPQLVNRLHPASTNIVTGILADVEDGGYHGTLVAGLAAAERDGSGLHGLAFDAEILAIRADSPGSCPADCSFTQANLAAATDYAVAQGANVINFSLGGASALSGVYRQALSRAVDSGAVIVLAAGNNGASLPTYPGRFAGEADADGRAIVVGAVNAGDTITGFSNRAGSTKDSYIVAPGAGIESTFPGGGTAIADGTSLAAPIVAGAAAALMDAAPSLSAEQVVTLLLTTATDLGAPGVDEVYGWGLLNLEEAIRPQGTLTIPTAWHVDDGGSAAAASALALEGPLAGAVFPASEVMMLDDFQRPYFAELDAFALEAERSIDIEGFMERRDEQIHHVELMGGQLGFSAFDAYGEARQWHVEQQLGQGLSFQAFVDERGRLGQIEDHFAFDLLEQKSAGHAFSGFAIGGGLAFERALPNGLELSLTAAGGETDSDDAASRLLAAGLAMPIGDGFDAHIRLGQLAQDGALLGSRGEGAFALNGWQPTSFAEISLEADLSANQALFWRGAVGRSEGQDADASQPVALDDFWSTSWAMGWQGRELLHTSDRLTVAFSQPLRAENAAVSTALPVARSLDGEVIRERRHERLDGQGRELDLEFAYRRDLDDEQTIGLNLLLRHEPGHDASADAEVIGVATYRLQF